MQTHFPIEWTTITTECGRVIRDLIGEAPDLIACFCFPDEENDHGQWKIYIEIRNTLASMIQVHVHELPEARIERVADKLQDLICMETFEARPLCPGHVHPAQVARVGSRVIWTCPKGGDWTCEVGAYSVA